VIIVEATPEDIVEYSGELLHFIDISNVKFVFELSVVTICTNPSVNYIKRKEVL